MADAPLRAAAIALPHAALLGATGLLVGHSLPPSLVGLWTYGPWAALGLSALIAAAFRRGRVLLAVVALAMGYWGYRFGVETGADQFASRTVFVASLLFVPVYLSAMAVLEERGVLNFHGFLRIVALIGAGVGVAWLISADHRDLTQLAFAPLLSSRSLPPTALPQLGAIAIVLAFAIAAGIAAWRRNAVDMGLATAIAAFGFAANGATSANVFSLFTVCACLSLLIAVLQDSYRMAFRDDLTGLPARRALSDRLKRLGRRYTIAMVDVDHFKGFNDTYGHDIGDDVLKMVASHLADVGGGGRAFRYGGEEFTVLFSGHSIKEAMPHLEALRRGIESHRMAVRAPSRPEAPRAGRKKRGAAHVRRTVSVTVSIGAAERSEAHGTPEEVIVAADQALYRAKHRGRNRVWL